MDGGGLLVHFKFSLRRARWAILGWGVPLALIGLFTIPFYDLVAENERQLRPVIEGMKPFVKSFIGGEDAGDLFSPDGFIALRYFAFVPVILGLFGAVAGSGMLAADEERGVLDFLLAHPAGRGALFAGRLAAMLVVLLSIVGLGWLGLWFGVLRADSLDFPPAQLALPYVSAFGVAALVGALALALSMVMPSRAAAAMAAGFVVFAGYIITNLAKAIPALEPWARFSPLSYFQADAMRGLDAQPLLGLMLVASLLASLAWLGFRSRDIRVAGDGGWRLPFAGRRRATR